MRYLLLFIFTLILSCNGQKKVAMKGENDMNPESEKFVMILQDNYSGSDIEESIVIKDAKTFKSFFSKINRTRKPGLPIPEVDFTKEMILVHCSGEQTSGDYAILSVAEENEKEVIISTSVEKFEKSESSSALISPFCVYKMPLTQKEVIFKKEQ